eukprot:12482388-Alexandrium_andersonii.AAC.1
MQRCQAQLLQRRAVVHPSPGGVGLDDVQDISSRSTGLDRRCLERLDLRPNLLLLLLGLLLELV